MDQQLKEKNASLPSSESALPLTQRMPTFDSVQDAGSGQPQLYSFKARQLPLRDALGLLAKAHGLNIVADPEVTGIVSVASVGGIRADLAPGTLIVPDQIIDYTWGRNSTFFEGGDTPVRHIDFTHPYDEPLRRRLLAAIHAAGDSAVDGGVYASTQGPRLESAAEINRLERDGADIVGMTGMPEAALARELELPYAAISVVVNYAAGRSSSEHGIHFDDIELVLQESMVRVRNVLECLCQV